MQRTMLGILSLLLIVAAGVIYLYAPAGSNDFFVGIPLRVGLVLGALWLAHPHLDVLPKVLLGFVVVLMLVIAVFARSKGLIIVGVGLTAVLLTLRALKPRNQTRATESGSDSRKAR